MSIKELSHQRWEKSKLFKYGFSAAVVLVLFNLFADYGTDVLGLFIEPKEPNQTAAKIMQELDNLEFNTDPYMLFLADQKYPSRNYVTDGVNAYAQLFSFFNRHTNQTERIDYIKFVDKIGAKDELGNPTAESRTAGAIFIYNEFLREGFDVPPPEYMLSLCGIESEWEHFSAPNSLTQGKNFDKAGEVTSIDWGFCQVNDYWHSDKMELAKSDDWLDNLYAAYLVVIDHSAWNPSLPSEEERLRHLAIKYHKPASDDLNEIYPERAWQRYLNKNTWWDPYFNQLVDDIRSGEIISSRGFWHPPVLERAAITFGYGKEVNYRVDGQYWHNAVDWNYPNCEGDPVFASQNGIVEVTTMNGLGNNVAILYWQENGYQFRATYGHLQSVTKTGAVMAGDVIGRIGRDGFGVDANGNQLSNGVPHLHYRVQVKNENGDWVAFNPCAFFDESIYQSNNWLARCTDPNNEHFSPYDNPDYFGIGQDIPDDTFQSNGGRNYVISGDDRESGGGMTSDSSEHLNNPNVTYDYTFKSMAYDGEGGTYVFNELLPLINYEARTGRNYIEIRAGETISFNDEFAQDPSGLPDQFIRGYLDYIQPSTGYTIPGGGACDTAHKLCTIAVNSGMQARQTNIDGYQVPPHPIGPGVAQECAVTIWIDHAEQGGTNRRDLEIYNPLSYSIRIYWQIIDDYTGEYRVWAEKVIDN